MVNGMLMETVDEINRSPTAKLSGFFSGFASATIDLKDEALFDASPEGAGRNRDRNERLGGGGGTGGLVSIVEGVPCGGGVVSDADDAHRRWSIRGNWKAVRPRRS